jgi:hypothetical protein
VQPEKNNAINPRLRIAEDGELLADSKAPLPRSSSSLALDPTAPAPVVYDSVPTLESLPPPVRETVRSEARGREVVDIDRNVTNGRTVYEIEFRASGRNPKIHVAEDGQLVGDTRANAPQPKP